MRVELVAILLDAGELVMLVVLPVR